jgi:hypothetical protein
VIDFAFENTPFPSSLSEEKHETLLSLVLTILEVMSFTISDPSEGLQLLLGGQQKLMENAGLLARATARPHPQIPGSGKDGCEGM